MPSYDQMRVPRGPTRKWEIVMEREGGERVGPNTAADVKGQHRLLRDIPIQRLRAVPLLPSGVALQRGERYFDLHNPARGEFPADGHEHVRPGQRVVAKAATPPDVWRALLSAADSLLRRRFAG